MPDGLTPRQVECLRLYALGYTHQEIGKELFMAYATVLVHMARARERLGAKNSVHAVTICLARGYLCVDYRDEGVYIPASLDDPAP